MGLHAAPPRAFPKGLQRLLLGLCIARPLCGVMAWRSGFARLHHWLPLLRPALGFAQEGPREEGQTEIRYARGGPIEGCNALPLRGWVWFARAWVRVLCRSVKLCGLAAWFAAPCLRSLAGSAPFQRGGISPSHRCVALRGPLMPPPLCAPLPHALGLLLGCPEPVYTDCSAKRLRGLGCPIGRGLSNQTRFDIVYKR